MGSYNSKTCWRSAAFGLLVGLIAQMARGSAYAQPFEVVRDPQGSVVILNYFGDGEYLENFQVDGKRLGSINSLQEVRLNNHDITDSELRFLATLKTVTSIDIGELAVEIELSGDELQQLGRMNWLTSLSVMETGLNAQDWRFLNALTKLERLSIYMEFSDDSAPYLAGLKQLREIHLGGEFTSITVRLIANLPQLQNVTLSSSSLDSGAIEHLKALPNLKTLSICSDRSTKAIFVQLGELEQLRGLNICMPVDQESLEQIKGLRLLTELSIKPTNGILFSLTEFMPQLRELRLFGSQETATLQKLANHPALETLLISESTLNIEAIDVLKSIPNLKMLHLEAWESPSAEHKASEELSHVHFVFSCVRK
jgi:hypothetical protein